MHQWKKGIASWEIRDTLYLSIPFTWLVSEAVWRIRTTKRKKVVVGGPGALLMKDKFKGQVEVQRETDIFEPVVHHNPLATFTTRGCPNRCPYCAVPKVEGGFREIKTFVPRPVICDNNFLASSKRHFDFVIDKLKKLPYIDFNQGLEARLFTSEKADGLAELKKVKIRFSYDRKGDEKFVFDAVTLARKKGLKDISCYLLFGFNDTPKKALEKAKFLRKLKIEIYPMRFQSLSCKKKNNYIARGNGWTDYDLKRFKRYWRGYGIFPVEFDEYDHRKDGGNEGFGLIPSIKKGREERWGK